MVTSHETTLSTQHDVVPFRQVRSLKAGGWDVKSFTKIIVTPGASGRNACIIWVCELFCVGSLRHLPFWLYDVVGELHDASTTAKQGESCLGAGVRQ